MNKKPIDFIITWVDGNDPKWQAEYQKYKNEGFNSVRYRDWDILKYWFRGVEKYASWVNKIHFVTCGQKPKWLNENHPKIHLVDHRDYIPEKYLPTFSSHTIELHFAKIPELADNFVYFNDDMFVINNTKESDFFVDDLPCDEAVLYPTSVNGAEGQFDHIMLNDAEFFDRHFDIKKLIKKNRSKWISITYGKDTLKTLFLMPFPIFPGIMLHHQPQSFSISTLKEVEQREAQLISNTSNNKFRTAEDINQYIFRYWQLGKGNFHPYNIMRRGIFFPIKNDADYQNLFNSKYKLVCLNDGDENVDFENEKKRLIKAFQSKFPQKSSFEK